MKAKKYQPILDLKPTQFAVGMLEIEAKVRELERMGKKKLHKYIKETTVPIVLSPWGEMYVTDHHHFILACWHIGVKRLRVEICEDFSKAKRKPSRRHFWQKMTRSRYVHLHDQFGEGPRKPLYLPLDIRGLGDDPYRSLAWMVREKGGFKSSSVKFAEFRWAELFRARRLLDDDDRRGFDRALPKALKLARSRVARKLPGYIGTPKSSEKV